MPKIVQFTHPGKEHSPDTNECKIKSWNTGNHKRKFLLCDGEFVHENKLEKNELVFWGEWEPPSLVTKFSIRPTEFHPQWLHKPYLPKELPNPILLKKNFQNTDPCVFGNSFKYLLCKQFKPKLKKNTSLTKLDKGSIILFGSTANQNTPEAFFQLDTVFVVNDHIDYDASDKNALISEDLGIYRDYVLKMAFPNPLHFPLSLKFYRGATFENRVNGMYSFSPSKIWKNEAIGFPRVSLKNRKYITNNLNAAPKISTVSEDEAIAFWNEIVLLSRSSGCVEGLNFNFNEGENFL